VRESLGPSRGTITTVTLQPRGPGGVPQTFDLEKLRAHCEELIPEAETRAEQALAAIIVGLIDKIYDMNYGLDEP
jgi:hypothetical protein